MRRFWIVLACAVFLAGLILDTGALLRVGWYYLWAGLRAHPWWAVGAVAAGLGLWAGRRWLARRGRKRRGKRGGKKRAAGGARKPRARRPPAEPAVVAGEPLPPPQPAPGPARGGRRRAPRRTEPAGS